MVKQKKAVDSTHSSEATEFRTEEEVVGDFRYIYRVNVTTGERKVIRRLPNRNLQTFGGSGNRLK